MIYTVMFCLPSQKPVKGLCRTLWCPLCHNVLELSQNVHHTISTASYAVYAMRPPPCVVSHIAALTRRPLDTLVLPRENLAAQIKDRQWAWNLHSFADFEDRKVPVQRCVSNCRCRIRSELAEGLTIHRPVQ
jgi:hypothetical protein